MNKFIAFLFALVISASAYAQPLQRNLYIIDENGNLITIKPPSGLVGNLNITMPSGGGTLITNNPTTSQTVSGGMTINGGTNVGTSLSLTDAAEIRWYEPTASGTNYTAFKAQAQASDITYTLPASLGSAGQVLQLSSVGVGTGTLSWTTVSGVGSTFDDITVGNTSGPLAGIVKLYDGQSGGNEDFANITTATLATDRTYTIPDAGANTEFVMAAGNQTIAGNKTFSGTTTLSGLTGPAILSIDANEAITASSSVGPTLGGTGLTSYTTGDLIYASAANTLAKLAVGTDGQLLRVSGGIPAWSSSAIVGSTGTTGDVTLYASDNNFQKIVGTAGTTDRTYTLPDVPSADFVMTEGTQTVNGDKKFTNFGTPKTTVTVGATTSYTDYDVAATNNVQFDGATVDFSVDGLANGFEGQRLRLFNNSSQKMTIVNGTSSGKIRTMAGNDIVLERHGAIDLVYDGTVWVNTATQAYAVTGQVGGTIFAIKTADESITNSSTLQNDDHLLFAVGAGQTWEVQGTVTVTENSNNKNFKFAFNAPGAATVKVSYIAYKASSSGIGGQGSDVQTANGTPSGSSTVGSGAGETLILDFRGIIETATAGTVNFQWAEQTAGGTLTVQDNSYLRATRVK